MTSAQIKALQERVGTVPDGFWGPQSIAACQCHLLALMPKPNPWPESDDASLRAFYGKPGETHLVNLDVRGLGVEYDGSPVNTVRCHRKVSASLHRVLTEISGMPCKWVLSKYAGCYNHRPMRGGSRLSTHAWGAAIDLWPEANGNTVHWPTRAQMPIEVMESFSREGWLCAGPFWSRDAMHAQATL